MQGSIAKAIIGIGSSLLQACTLLDHQTPSTAHDDIGNFDTIGVTADRRFVIANEKGDDTFCAEPSPDVTFNTSELARGLIQAAVDSPQGIGADAVAELSRSMATTAQLLATRSQGIMLFRDGMFYLCIARMNGWITTDDFVSEGRELRQKAYDLMLHQIEKGGLPNIPTSSAATAPALPAPPDLPTRRTQ
jgi:hypothetical protein